jgi:hypothetical protein
MRNLLLKLLVLAAASLSVAAHADTYTATLMGDSNTFVFTLPSQFSFPNQIHLVALPPIQTTGTANGVANQTFSLTFFSGIAGGESLTFSDITNFLSFNLYGIPVVSPGTDPNAPPTYLTADIDTGTFNLIYVDLTGSNPIPNMIPYTLTIAPSAPTPEPSTLLLLGTGMIGLLTCIGRRAPGTPFIAQSR